MSQHTRIQPPQTAAPTAIHDPEVTGGVVGGGVARVVGDGSEVSLRSPKRCRDFPLKKNSDS
jgi:hypothetical protein